MRGSVSQAGAAKCRSSDPSIVERTGVWLADRHGRSGDHLSGGLAVAGSRLSHGRDQIAAIHQASAERIMGSGDHAAERAAILLSLVGGIQMMRQMIGLKTLADADPETLVRLLAPLFDWILSAAPR